MATGTQLNNLGVCGNANLVGYNAQKVAHITFKTP